MEIGWCFLFAIGISSFALQSAGESVEVTERQNVTAGAIRIIDDQKAELVVEPTKRRQLLHIPHVDSNNIENNVPKCQKGYKFVGWFCALSVSTTESNIRTGDTVTEATVDYSEETHDPISEEDQDRSMISVRENCNEGFKLYMNKCRKMRRKPICKSYELLKNGVCQFKFTIFKKNY
jgi:hypothetical protein